MKLLLVALLSFGTAVPAPADTTPPEIRSIELSRESITVNGLEVKLLTVTVHVTDESGVKEYQDSAGGHWPWLSIGHASVALTLGRGTPQDGWYTGGAAVTSDWAGAYQPDYLNVQDTTGNVRSGDPATMDIDVPTVEVTSTGKPEIALSFTPNPATVGAAVTATMRVTDAAGKPWPGVPVAIGYDVDCAEDTVRRPEGHTSAAGTFAETMPAGQTYDGWFCAWALGDNVPEQNATRIGSTSAHAVFRYELTARPAATSTPAGSNVAVTGTLAPRRTNKELQLQRRYANNDWRTVNRGRTNDDSAFTISATPPGVGTYSYRVFAPADADRAGATSPVFTVRGY